jgi:hypothetical protein
MRRQPCPHLDQESTPVFDARCGNGVGDRDSAVVALVARGAMRLELPPPLDLEQEVRAPRESANAMNTGTEAWVQRVLRG